MISKGARGAKNVLITFQEMTLKFVAKDYIWAKFTWELLYDKIIIT